MIAVFDPASLAAKWFSRGQSDLRGARYYLSLAAPDDFENSCSHSQQAAEKALKGFLVLHSVFFQKTHDLDELCKLCEGCGPSFAAIRSECKALTTYKGARYPDYPDVNESEAEAALQKAEKIFAFCHSLFLSSPATAGQPTRPE